MRDILQNENTAKKVFQNLKKAAIISFVAVLPFALLEFAFNTAAGKNVPDLLVLFGFLWLLSTAFIVIMMPVAQNIRAGNYLKGKLFNLLLRVAFSAFILTIWVGIVIDQLPCFLGAAGCD